MYIILNYIKGSLRSSYLRVLAPNSPKAVKNLKFLNNLTLITCRYNSNSFFFKKLAELTEKSAETNGNMYLRKGFQRTIIHNII